MNQMKELYVKEVAPALMQKFQYKSSMQIPPHRQDSRLRRLRRLQGQRQGP